MCLEGDSKMLKLPTELWLHILSYLDTSSLCTLSTVSKQFYFLSNDFTVWRDHCARCLVTGSEVSDPHQWIKCSANHRISIKDLYKTNHEWCKAHFKDITLKSARKKYFPKLLQDATCLWVTNSYKVSCYRRSGNGVHTKNRLYEICDCDHAEINACVGTRCHLVCASSSKSSNYFSVYCCETGRLVAREVVAAQPMREQVTCMSSVDERTFVVGSAAGYVSVLQLTHGHSLSISVDVSTFLPNKVLCCSSNPWRPSQAALGTAARTCPDAPIYLVDVERAYILQILSAADTEQRVGAGILDLVFHTPHTLFAGGYESLTSWYDVRIPHPNQRVMCMCDPDDNMIYQIRRCCARDAAGTTNAILTGTSHHGVVRLWDVRRADAPVQTYYVGSGVNRKYGSSPIYSLLYNTTHMYAARDSSVHLLNFS